MEERRNTYLTKHLITTLYIYLLTLLVGTMVGLYFFLEKLPEKTSSIPLNICFLGSVLCSMASCSVFYIRKLYKDSLNEALIVEDVGSIKTGSTFVYYFFRPLFGAVFAIVVVLILRAENKFVSPTGVLDSHNFLFVSMLLSFICGFSSGRFIKFLEKQGGIL